MVSPGCACADAPTSTEAPGDDRPTVLIVDDHVAFRRGLRELLADHFAVVGEARDGAEAVHQASALAPNVVVLDVALPEMDGLEATRHIRQRLPATQVVVLSARTDEDTIVKAVRAGACTVVDKCDAPASILLAIDQACRGRVYVPPWVMRHLDVAQLLGRARTVATDGEPARKPLTKREQAVLRLVAGGASRQDAAAQLGLSPRTIANHMANVYAKLGISNRAGAIRYAVEHGLIELDSPRAGC